MVEEAQARTRRRPLARESVLEAVADAEGIEVSDEELLEALGRTAEREGTEPAKLLERLKETGRDVPVRRELRLRKRGRRRSPSSAQPIEPGKAKAREQIWTPDKQRKEEGSAQLWTPGAGDPAAPSAADRRRSRVARAGSGRLPAEAIGRDDDARNFVQEAASMALGPLPEGRKSAVARIAARRRDSDVLPDKHSTSRREAPER